MKRVMFAALFLLGLDAPSMFAQAKDLPDVEARLVRHPMPNFPQEAAQLGLSGACDVLFDIDKQGRTLNIRPMCTHRAFCESSAKAMKEARFMPERKDGMIVHRAGVTYPLEYVFEGIDVPSLEDNELVECVSSTIS